LSGRPSHASKYPSIAEQFKVASIQTSWKYVRTHFRVLEELGFPLETRIWEDNCIHLEDRVIPSGQGP